MIYNIYYIINFIAVLFVFAIKGVVGKFVVCFSTLHPFGGFLT